MTLEPSGFDIDVSTINPRLYDFQKAIVKWAVKRGRAAVWSDCGTGKTLVQLEWARLVGGRALILAPLAVARQTIEEAEKLGLRVPYVRTPNEWDISHRIAITNYERLGAFDECKIDAVVCDESGILKSFSGATRGKLIARFQSVLYRLACTATPAPNDYRELGNHAAFLGIMSWQEMAAMFFVHDGQSGNDARNAQWRLKGHAADDFWRWLVSWGVFIRKPSDIGFDDTRFKLPPLTIEEEIVKADVTQEGMLFATRMQGIGDRSRIRRATLETRIARAAELIRGDKKQWIAWCGLNDEADRLAELLGDECINVSGDDEPEEKAEALFRFAHGTPRVLVSKVKIAGLGMNLQNCARQVFVGIGDSYEQYYQAIRRSWRYGQTEPVKVSIVVSEIEERIVANVREKELAAERMAEEMVKRMSDLEKAEIHGTAREEASYKRDSASGDGWKMALGDCVDVLKEIGNAAIDFSVYSPPFSNLFTYTNSPRDMGNCRGEEEFFKQFTFMVRDLLRVTKPGRLTACHLSQLPAMLSRDGWIGLKDFRGAVIRCFTDNGWVHHGEFAIQKNPQAQAIRTKARGLLFVTLKRDSTLLRPALADFVCIFSKPGENAVPVIPDVTNEEWIEWAQGIWTGIRETEVLQVREARDEKDEKHLCPLQLDVIDRLVRLYTNKGETVFSPFAGIGSEGYQAILRGRKFIGVELKESYWRVACENLKLAVRKSKEGELFSEA